MKHTAFVTCLLAATAFGGAATAGSLSDPVVSEKIIVEDTTSSSAGDVLVVALAYLILIPVLD